MPMCDGGSYTGPSRPRPPSSDSNEDREMDFDDHHDFIDQIVHAGQLPTADPGPIHQFLSAIQKTSTGLWKAFPFL